MNADVVVFLVPIISTIAICALIFGIRYFINREKMAMIERGLSSVEKKRNYSLMLAFGLLFVGFGTGLFIAFLLTEVAFGYLSTENAVAIYFSMIFIFGGLGLTASYLISEKKEREKEERNY
ncbi:hypothetical protein EDD80_102376 [Anseongella ginsenosidimutans]|uniref:DUF6249 domain-containing protein n=1 Tax=Anseongella ginsenosidimutans TaxID=496056 RepID=A0A4R3KYV8_9SPHI|nr:DUF6249 domain-containing protein [Anseongella ginsenosidimutans]QEC51810.1 hypothetical protein FRZ59_05295 [Anseongella ginsenosidimutans]TCS89182.1 hypothetical protein EDD80_102376 [Anseongella ginsenosidimutans]